MEELLTQLFNPNADTIQAIGDALNAIGVSLYEHGVTLNSISNDIDSLKMFCIAMLTIGILSVAVSIGLVIRINRIEREFKDRIK